MPLMGRHNSRAESASAGQQHGTTRTASGQQEQQPAVCESPLFGLRRQLPMVTVPFSRASDSQQNNSSSSCTRNRAQHYSAQDHLAKSKVKNNNNNYSPNKSELTNNHHQQEAYENTLGSIPKQITRQQIHYAFTIMDTNSDGLIDSRDLSQMLANLGIPIDESILAHVLTGASKQGDRCCLSESDFLNWFGHFVQVSEDDEQSEGASSPTTNKDNTEKATARSRLANKWSTAGNKWRKRPVVRSATAGSSLMAAGCEQVPPLDSLRRRRGSGSGLALTRSLSSAAQKTLSRAEEADSDEAADEQRQQQQPPAAAGASDLEEARNDLRAAFCVFDLDGDGFITIDEVRAGLKLLDESWTPAELNQLFSRSAGSRAQASGARASSLRANDLRQRISIDDFVQMLL